MTSGSASGRVLVIGAGIIGLSVALRLALDGRAVTVVDSAEPMEGCSAGNAGCLSEANLFPPATVDSLLHFPQYLLSKSGPLAIRPSYLGTMVPWMCRAGAALIPQRHDQIVAAMAGLTSRAIASFDALTSASSSSHLISRKGLLVACRSRKTLQSRARRMPLWERSGIDVVQLDGREMRDVAPALKSDLHGGLLFRNSGRCSDPRRLGLSYATHLRSRGATISRARVLSLGGEAGSPLDVLTEQGTMKADSVVVCAGHRSAAILGTHARRVPLACERGYHLMLPAGLRSLELPVIFGEPFFAATPMDDGLRLAGTAEFSPPNAPADFNRAWLLLEQANDYLEGVDATDAVPWMGTRPSLPDGMPAIGRLPHDERVAYAFGHGHNGLTLSAVTADCVSALFAGRKPPVNLDPFALERFH